MNGQHGDAAAPTICTSSDARDKETGKDKGNRKKPRLFFPEESVVSVEPRRMAV